MGFINKITSMLATKEDPYNYDELNDDVAGENEELLSRRGYDNAETKMDISTSAAIELKVVKPESYSNVTEIADHLLNHRTVVLNLESTNREIAKRLIDFLAGVAYSINGQLRNVANNTYIITPCNVDVADAEIKVSEAQQNPNYQATNTNIGLTSDSLF